MPSSRKGLCIEMTENTHRVNNGQVSQAKQTRSTGSTKGASQISSLQSSSSAANRGLTDDAVSSMPGGADLAASAMWRSEAALLP